MARLPPYPAQPSIRAMAGLLSAVLHLGLAALILLSGGRADGTRDLDPTSTARMTWLDSRPGTPRDGVERAPRRVPIRELAQGGQIEPMRIESPGDRPAAVEFAEVAVPAVAVPRIDIPQIDPDGTAPGAPDVAQAGDVADAAGQGKPPVVVMSSAEAAELLERVERLAAGSTGAQATRVSWEQDGRRYEAELVPEPARDALEPERVIAEVSTESQGRQLRTWISLRRLPFSHFAKLVDRWDPMVQLHDDVIVGRMHVNSRFNLLYDSQAAPRLAGKVTTAAGGFNVERRGRERNSDVFLAGIETKADRVPFSRDGSSFQWSGYRDSSRVHPLARSTSIRFLGDAGYAWREEGSGEWRHAGPPGEQPVFFVAAPGAAVGVMGTVSGRFVVYSPRLIVVQGDIRYARDPRSEPDSGDLLGLVSDLDIEVARPEVTGPGDLHIHAALYAGRRMIVADADVHRRKPATLSILGSLAAGTLTESEPRYATRIEYDRRLERHRPPGFPSMDRFSSEHWDREWVEESAAPWPAAQGRER